MSNRRAHLFILTSILIASFSLKSGAQDYEYIQYTTKDGLPSNYVYGVVEDEEGYIWAYTENGLSKFDGYTFQNYTTQDGLPSNDISYADKDQHGRIWLSAFRQKGAYLFRDSIHRLPTDLPTGYIGIYYGYALYSSREFIYADNTQQQFFLNKAYKIDTLVWDSLIQIYHNDLQIKSEVVGGLFWPNGHFILFQDGLVIWKNKNQYKSICLPNPISVKIDAPTRLKYAHLTGTNSFIIRMGLGELYYVNFDNGEVKNIKLSQYHLYPKAHVEISTFQSTFIVNTDAGYLEFDFQGKLLTKITLDKLIPHHYLLRAYRDSKGNFWVGSRQGGIFMIPKQYFISQSLHDFEKSRKSFEKFYQLDKQTLFCITDHSEIFIYQNDNLKNISPRGNGLFRSIQNTPYGLFIYDGISGKVLKKEKDSWISFDIQNTFKNSWVSEGDQLEKYVGSKIEDYRNRRNQLFLPDQNTLYQALGNRMEIIQFRDNGKHIIKSTPHVSDCLFHHPEQDLILSGNNEGLFLQQSDQFIPFLREYRDLKDIVSIEGEGNNLWIGTKNDGIFHYQFSEKRISKIYNIRSLRKIKQDSDSTLLLTTSLGIEVISKYLCSLIPIEKYGALDGLPSTDIRDIHPLNDSISLVATFKGLHKINRHLKKSIPLTLNDLILKSFKVNNQVYSIDSLPNFHYKQNDFDLSFHLQDFASNGQIIYKHKLTPIEEKWISSTDRSIRYPSLSPGKYTFHLKAENAFGQEVLHDPISFQIKAPFWERTWFLLIVGLLVLIGFIAVINYRDRLQRNKLDKEKRLNQKLTELELTALKAQMNPHFVFNALGSIQYFIQTQDVELADGYLAKFAKLMRMYLDSSKEKMIPLEQEMKLLRIYTDLEKMRFEDHFKVRIDKAPEVDENDCYLPSMMIQPLIENAINHGLENRRDGKGLLEVIFKKEQQHLVCLIKDNGIGRSNAAKLRNKSHRSRGLALIKEKIQTLQNSGIAKINMQIRDLHPQDSQFPGTMVRLVIEDYEDRLDNLHK